MLEAPDNLSLPSILAVAQGSHARLRVILVALFGTDRHTLLSMKEVNSEIM